MDEELVPCKHMFSNGTEFAYFVETQCFNGCSYYRRHHCKILNAIEVARWIGESVFPFEWLLDWKHYAGKRCKRFSTEPIPRKQKTTRPIEGQVMMEEKNG